jgi:transcriptional regulator with XRE-family HTH domain
MKSNLDYGIDKNAFNVALGKRLCALRVQHEKSQSYVGDRLGVSYQQIHKYETGETQISPSQLLIYAQMFNVSIAYLYGMNRQDNDCLDIDDEDINIFSSNIIALPRDVRKTFIRLAQQICTICNCNLKNLSLREEQND